MSSDNAWPPMADQQPGAASVAASAPDASATTPAPAETEFAGNGRLSLGDNAISYHVSVARRDAGVVITGSDGASRTWPLDGLAALVPLHAKLDDVLLTSTAEPGATLFLADPALIAEIAGAEPRLATWGQRAQPIRMGLAFAATIAAFVGALAALGISPVSTLAHRLPEGLRVRFGQNVLTMLTNNARACTSAEGNAALAKMTARLTATVPEAARYRVTAIAWPVLNAFTAPGGQIVVTRGLIDKADSADELAGVIAHEIGHAIELHPEAGIIRALGFKAASEVMFAGSSLNNVGLMMAQLSYTRDAEREADAHAFRLLKASGVSPKGIADFFRRVAVKEEGGAATPPKSGSWPPPEAKTDGSFSPPPKPAQQTSIFSSHPASLERAALADAQQPYATTPALEAAEWTALKTICGTEVPKPSIAAKPSAAPPPKTAPENSRQASLDKPPQATTLPTDIMPRRPGSEKLSPSASGDLEAIGIRTRAEAKLQSGDVDGAVADLREALEKSPASVEGRKQLAAALVRKGTTALEKKDLATALGDLEWAVKFASEAEGAAKALAARAAAIAAKGDRMGAVADYNAAALKSPKNAQIAAARAKYLDSIGMSGLLVNEQLKDARNLKSVPTVTPSGLPPQFGLPGTPLPSGNPPPRAPAPAEANTRRTGAQKQLTDVELSQVIVSASNVLMKNTGDVDALKRRSDAYARLGKAAESLSDAERIIVLQPADIEGLRLRGRARLIQQDASGAIADLSIVVTQSPKDAEALVWRARANARLKNLDAALADFRLASGLRTFAGDHTEIGRVLASKRDFRAALAAYDRALQIDSRFIVARVDRGRAHEGLGDREAAIADYRAALRVANPSGGKSTAQAQKTARERLTALGASD